jgi:hypothetical protein
MTVSAVNHNSLQWFFQTSFDIVLVWVLSCLSNRKFLNTLKFFLGGPPMSHFDDLKIYPYHPLFFL